MKLRQCLEMLKTQNYEIWLDNRAVGTITRELLGEDSIAGYIFSSCELINYLDSYVEVISPVSVEPGSSRCLIILDYLPFD